MKYCPHCHGTLVLLGTLGAITHYRCRNCGSVISQGGGTPMKAHPVHIRTNNKRTACGAPITAKTTWTTAARHTTCTNCLTAINKNPLTWWLL